MPVIRISEGLTKKIHMIMDRTGWKTPNDVLEQIMKEINPDEFSVLGQIVVIEKRKGTK
jgi:hypothetical protein